MATVVLIRHGRTHANVAGILAGRQPGVGLDERGVEQARAVGERLRGTALSAVVHSPLERCTQTARIILEACTGQAPLHPEPRLTECDYGSWTGRRLEELAQDPMWSVVMERPSQMTFPGGEAMADMAARAVAAVVDWCDRLGEGAVLAVVSHGDVIKAVLSDALAQPLDDFQRIAVSPGSISVVRFAGPRPLVLRMNDTGGGALAPAPPAQAVGGTVA